MCSTLAEPFFPDRTGTFEAQYCVLLAQYYITPIFGGIAKEKELLGIHIDVSKF